MNHNTNSAGANPELDSGERGRSRVWEIRANRGEESTDTRLDHECPNEDTDDPGKLVADQRSEANAKSGKECRTKNRPAAIRSKSSRTESHLVTMSGEDNDSHSGGNDSCDEAEEGSHRSASENFGEKNPYTAGGRKVGERGCGMPELPAGDNHSEDGSKQHGPPSDGGDRG